VGAELGLDVVHIAEARARGAPGVGGRHPARLEVAREHVEVEADLVVDIGVDVRAPEAEVAPPTGRPLPGPAAWHAGPSGQVSAGAARSTRVTAPA
jgi:hypothetical protein